MTDLRGSKTHQNLVVAFARESQTVLRYLWFAQIADVDGRPEVAALLRSLADGETGHAYGLLEHLIDLGDPLTAEPLGETSDHLRAAIASESYEVDECYPSFAATARQEGHDDIADWLDTLARAESAQLQRLRAGLDSLG